MLDPVFKLAGANRELGEDVVGTPWRIHSGWRAVLDRLSDLEPVLTHLLYRRLTLTPRQL